MSTTKQTYADKLRDPRWQRKRLELLHAADWKCQHPYCTQGEDVEKPTLHVHHKVYLRGLNPWEYEDWSYSVLCDKCHGMAQTQMEQNHCLLAKHHNLRALFALISRLDADAQSEVSEYLGDIVLISAMPKMKINTCFFKSIAEFARLVFANGSDCGRGDTQD